MAAIALAATAGRLREALGLDLFGGDDPLRRHGRGCSSAAGSVKGVRLAGDEEVPAQAVVSTVTASLLARLLPAGALPGRLHRRLRIWRYGTGPFKVDYALSGPVPWTTLEARSSAVMSGRGAARAPLRDRRLRRA